jgi:putative flippase GtrA
MIVFLLAWTITSSSLAALHTVYLDATPSHELIVLTAANVLATLMRFVLLRLWVFRRRSSSEPVHALSLAPAKEPAL